MNRAKEKALSHSVLADRDKGTQKAVIAVLLLPFYHKKERSVTHEKN